jgi:hypothetical protein
MVYDPVCDSPKNTAGWAKNICCGVVMVFGSIGDVPCRRYWENIVSHHDGGVCGQRNELGEGDEGCQKCFFHRGYCFIIFLKKL